MAESNTTTPTSIITAVTQTPVTVSTARDAAAPTPGTVRGLVMIVVSGLTSAGLTWFSRAFEGWTGINLGIDNTVYTGALALAIYGGLEYWRRWAAERVAEKLHSNYTART